MPKLTFDQALEIQRDHLAQWRNKLTPQAYAHLAKETARQTACVRASKESAYLVPRGEALYDIVANYHPGGEHVQDIEDLVLLARGIERCAPIAADDPWGYSLCNLNITAEQLARLRVLVSNLEQQD